MQENKLISTIETLKSFGQTEAISVLAKDLKEAYDFAIKILKDGALNEVKEKEDFVGLENNKKYSDYNSNWNLLNKFQYILKTENRFLHFREVASIIRNLEGQKESYFENKKLARALSSANSIRELKKKGIIVNVLHQKNIKKSFWGSSKWVDKNNDILPEHMYSLDVVNNAPTRKTKQIYNKSLFEI